MAGEHSAGKQAILDKINESPKNRRNSKRSDDSDGPDLGEIRARARMDASALLGNYRAIQELAGSQALLPMVKANAYGHGLEWAVRTLATQPNLYGIGVATLAEGAEARLALGLRNRRTPVLVFSGTGPWTDDKGAYCEAHGLTPVIGSDDDWTAFMRGRWATKLQYEIKFNTGMNRLGLSAGLASRIARDLRSRPTEEHPQGILSHLATAESPDHKLTRLQLDRFADLKRELKTAFPAAQFHLANSSAIWNAKHYRLDDLTDVVRPGLSLYGVNPWDGASARGIHPVMTLEAQVIALHRLKAGESVGYGARYVVSAGEFADGMRTAILGAGYADGLPRTLTGSNTGGGKPTGGYAWLGGRATRLVGVVSMDMCAVIANQDTRAGDWVEILGPHVDHWAQARMGGTIPYELLTSVSSVSSRVKRVYD